MKKFLSVILTLCMLASLVVIANAAYGEHEHQLMHMRNEVSHYSECTICYELFNAGNHTMVDGACTVCNYPNEAPRSEEIKGEGEHEHQLMKMANMNCHYSECTICFELFDVGDHTFKDGVCTVCGHDELINPFVDVKPDAWYYDKVVQAVDTGIINGKTPTEFKPDDLLTYAEALKLAACMNQVYNDGKVTLANGEPWYKPYVDYCRNKGIINGQYEYNQNATRAGYMEIFANALPEEAFKEINRIPDGSILDVKTSASYAHYVYKLYRAGIVTGVDELHNCNPEANIKRSEVATIISRMMNEDERVRFDMGEEGDDDNGDKKEDEPLESEITTPDVEIDNGKASVDVNNSDIEITEDNQKYEFDGNGNDLLIDDTKGPLEIDQQPVGVEAESYGEKIELEVHAKGGKAPYSYSWKTVDRRDTVDIANGDYVKDVTSDALVISIEKENTLLGKNIFCVVTDAEGTKVESNKVKVYGPFSLPSEDVLIDSATKQYTIAGNIADGVIRKGDKVSVERNGKIIATGVAVDLQMFDKSIDECAKGDRIGLVFVLEKGVRPQSGDTVIKYKDTHVIDTSDIVN